MNKREELKAFTDQQYALEDQASACYQKAEPIIKKRCEVVADILIEENLLKGSRWVLDSHATLSLDGDPKSQPEIKHIIDTVGINFYGIILLETGIELEITFDNFTFRFDDPKLLPLFVKKTGMIVDSVGLVQRLRSVKREVSALESLCHLLNIKA